VQLIELPGIPNIVFCFFTVGISTVLNLLVLGEAIRSLRKKYLLKWIILVLLCL